MRAPRLSLASIALLLASTACGVLYSDPECGDDDDDSYDCGDPYDGYQDPGTPGDTDAVTCNLGFATAFSVADAYGECVVTFGDDSYDPTAALYSFAVPAGAASACDALEGPALESCSRTHSTIVVGSANAATIAGLVASLDLTGGPSTTFEVTLACAHLDTPQSQSVSLQCVPPNVTVVADRWGRHGHERHERRGRRAGSGRAGRPSLALSAERGRRIPTPASFWLEFRAVLVDNGGSPCMTSRVRSSSAPKRSFLQEHASARAGCASGCSQRRGVRT